MATVQVRIVILTVRITLSVCPFNRMAHTANNGQHGHGGVFFTKFKREATRRQFTKIKIYGPLLIMVLLSLVPRDCSFVVVLAQDER
jgi:hypothetical protein